MITADALRAACFVFMWATSLSADLRFDLACGFSGCNTFVIEISFCDAEMYGYLLIFPFIKFSFSFKCKIIKSAYLYHICVLKVKNHNILALTHF